MPNVTTTRGVYCALGTYFRNESTVTPPGFKVALITAAGTGTTGTPVAPSTTNCQTWAAVSANEVPPGNGYTAGGLSVARNATDWPTFVEDTVNQRAILGTKLLKWTAAGGNLPLSGTGAAYAVLYDDNAAKNVIAVSDLGGNRVVSDSQELILVSLEYVGEALVTS